MIKKLALVPLVALAFTPALAQQAPMWPPNGNDVPAKFTPPVDPNADYIKREVMIPMRDGTKLYTVIVIPKGATNAPIVLTRTPYNAAGRAKRSDSPSMLNTLPLADEIFVRNGYIRVYQDIRGKYGSEGGYVTTRPPVGPLNDTKVDHTTDAYDTIDWLVNKANLPQSNGKVGMIGSSYEGLTVVMALLHPHPALKVAAPQSPMVDGWMGDDWFHYGAFRQVNLDYFTGQSSKQAGGQLVPREGYDDYQNFLDAGSAGHWADEHGFKQLPWWNRLAAHPAYDAFWQLQALDKIVPAHASDVPTIWLQGLWDQEDMYGAIHTWEELKKSGHGANNHLVMGPWYHSQVNRTAWDLGPLKWNGDTAADFRKNYLIPFFDQYLKDEPQKTPLPEALIYNPVENHWDKFSDWPVAAQQQLTPLYLQADKGLAFQQAAAGEDSYVSDPAKPVPYLNPPIPQDNDRWQTWLEQDQRFVATRPDVLSYMTPVLTKAVRIEGAPIADIFVKTTGTDGDFVVKLIDVYPAAYPEKPEMGGYQLPISMDIFRGRYRKSFSDPSPIPAGEVQEYKFRLPTQNYVFKPGHRIMVQIQSSLFPLYDRNPQKYVPNIFFAKPADYQKATISIEHGPPGASSVLLPVVAASTAVN